MKRLSAFLGDSVMCGMMYVLQRRHRLPGDVRQQTEAYLERHSEGSRASFYTPPEGIPPLPSPATASHGWNAPVASPFAENARCHALLFPCAAGWKAPTVIMLHALMSASDRGYRAWARDFNGRGWNAIFVHLPYHYSRTPRRHLNGELAITADIIRTAEGLRSGVMEVRQLMDWVRGQGGREFGLWACSYGGWIGSLVASLEAGFRWIALLEPIADLSDALWRSAAGSGMRHHLVRGGIGTDLVAQFQPLICPSHAPRPAGEPRILIVGGAYDRIARPEELRALHRRWTGSEMLLEPQGHFGFRIMQAAWRWLDRERLV